MTTDDLELLQEYTRKNSEESFTALVNRHLNLVYSAALRQVRSPQLAEEVAQSVFTDLARNAPRLAPDTILTAWLYQVSRRTAIDVVRREARRQLREQVATEMNSMNASAADWTHIEPLLDEAMLALDDTDRAAVLLRYFENQSLREVGAALGTSDDAAQKRVTRAVERLREYFAQRGVTIGASGLVVVLSANAVQAAPAGLFATISATALAGTTLATTATATAAKTIAMTTLQKTLITVTLALVAGAGIYEARQTSALQTQVQTLQQLQADKFRQLQHERDDATNQLASLLAENEQLKSNQNPATLLKLRSEVTRLRNASVDPAATQPDPREDLMKSWLAREDKLKEVVKQNPGKAIPELQLLSEQDWLNAARDAKFGTEKEIRRTLANLRRAAENIFAPVPAAALTKYMRANNEQFPTELSQLQPYFDAPMDDAILSHWKIVPVSDFPNLGIPGDWVITEKAPVDPEFDIRYTISPGGYRSSTYQPSEYDAAMMTLESASKAYAAANNGKDPSDPSQILPYLVTPEQQAAYQTFMKKRNATNAPSQ